MCFVSWAAYCNTICTPDVFNDFMYSSMFGHIERAWTILSLRLYDFFIVSSIACMLCIKFVHQTNIKIHHPLFNPPTPSNPITITITITTAIAVPSMYFGLFHTTPSPSPSTSPLTLHSPVRPPFVLNICVPHSPVTLFPFKAMI